MALKCLKCLLKYSIYFFIVFLIIVNIPGIPPNGNFTANRITPSKPLEGIYSINSYLNNADHLYVNKVKGPETFAEWKGELYTSVHGGYVVKLLENGQIIPIVKLGEVCDGYWQESKCGRPLGLAFDKNGILYISDAYYGIWKVNIETNKKQLLVSPNVEIEGKKPKLFNSIVVAKNGDLYWTDSSTDMLLEDGVISVLLDGSGRLLHYDAVLNKSRVLLDGLWFANGVTLSPNEEFVVVSETIRSQLRRYYLKGDKKGSDDIFIDGLPGIPDNLHSDASGILVALAAPRDPEHPLLFQSIAPHPLIRKFLARFLVLLETPFRIAQNIMPHYIFERAIHMIGHFESVHVIVSPRSTIVKLDWSGNVIGCWHNIDGSLKDISDAFIFKDHLYLGSFANNYVGRVPIPVDFESYSSKVETETISKSNNKVKEIPNDSTTTTQTIKTTTVKPTVKTSTTEAIKTSTTATPTKAESTTIPVTTPKPTEAERTTIKPVTTPKTTQTPKPQTTVKSKPTENSPKVTKEVPPVEAKNVKSAAEEKQKPTTTKDSSTKPIIENIPSDTKLPLKDNIKVIKKDGPSEIPNPDRKDNAKAVKNEL